MATGRSPRKIEEIIKLWRRSEFWVIVHDSLPLIRDQLADFNEILWRSGDRVAQKLTTQILVAIHFRFLNSDRAKFWRDGARLSEIILSGG